MVYELSPDRFGQVAPLFAHRWFDEAFIDSIFEGTQTARLFVDNLHTPTAALICRSYEYYIAGDIQVPHLRQFIADAPAEAGVFEELYGYCALQREWDRALLDDHAGQLRVIGRRRFRFNATTSSVYDWRRLLPAEMDMRPIDRSLVPRINAVIAPIPGMGAFMGGVEQFLSRGFGFCVMRGDDIASVASTGSVSNQFADIDIVTAEPFRGRGLATLAAAACTEEAVARGLTPTWHTDTTNEASMATARKLQFEEGRPFSQISPPWGAKVRLSSGLWRATTPGPAMDAPIEWRRRGVDE